MDNEMKKNIIFFSSFFDTCKTPENSKIMSSQMNTSIIGPTSNSIKKLRLKKTWGPYLAGLIEGDGSIIVPQLDSKGLNPLIRICFNEKDLPFAQYLVKMLGYGRIVFPKKGKFILLEISDFEGLYYIVNLINGYFRTPKIEACHRLIEFLNVRSLFYLNSKDMGNFIALNKQSLDISPIVENSWLAGMTDADGNFNVIISKPKNKKSMRIQTQYTLELRQQYHRSSIITTSYFDIMSAIAINFNTKLYARSRMLNNTICNSYVLVAGSIAFNFSVNSYFTKFPLYSSKRLDYLDWDLIRSKVRENVKLKSKKPQLIKECTKIKSGMNSKRNYFNWDHLKLL
uniref:Putative LAGLIDADG homing endonuclease n=1 Tax=Stigeoclonium helveticum TaxID=55999 RepID=A0A6M4SRA2_STIHE|nr:putative LAGLIDADG homing endonuclease [Stigeoclonium helveticum]